jgi:hypothetical protein
LFIVYQERQKEGVDNKVINLTGICQYHHKTSISIFLRI